MKRAVPYLCFVVPVFSYFIFGVTGCSPSERQDGQVSIAEQEKPGKRLRQTPDGDKLTGWFKLPGRRFLWGDRYLSFFLRDGVYYSVCRGFEIPFKRTPEALEWGLAPSSMKGTRIAFADKQNSCYLIVVDQQLMTYIDSDDYNPDEKHLLTRTSKPLELLETLASPPRTNDDFLGWFQPVYQPHLIQIEVKREGENYLALVHVQREPGLWTPEKPCELRPRENELGFTGKHAYKNNPSLSYNESLQRFELTLTLRGDSREPVLIRMPLAPIPSSDALRIFDASQSIIAIGIPSWH